MTERMSREGWYLLLLSPRSPVCECRPPALPGLLPGLWDGSQLPLMLTMWHAGRAGRPLHYLVLKEMPPSSALAFLNFTTTKFTPAFFIANESGAGAQRQSSFLPASPGAPCDAGHGTHAIQGCFCPAHQQSQSSSTLNTPMFFLYFLFTYSCI